MSHAVEELRAIVAQLRSPGGCPWDLEQDHQSIRHALIEECYEVVEAIEAKDDANLREELGDLLLHVAMHARMAEERGAFNFDEVARDISAKMIRRHPHVFGEASADNSQEVLQQWESIKRREKSERTSILDGIPQTFPALMVAQKLQKKAAKVGFDWPDALPVLAKIREEITELEEALASGQKDEAVGELGDVLFSVVNLARKLEIDAEVALRQTNRKFSRRFRHMEKMLAQAGLSWTEVSVDKLEQLWEEAKQHGETHG